MEQKMKLGILGTGMIVKEFLPWLAGADSPFQVQALCSTQRSAPLAAELCARYHEANRPAAVTARRCGQAASASATKPSF